MAVITGTSGNDNLPGTADSDEIHSLARDDHLSGLDSNNLLEGGTGADQVDSGNGFDYAAYWYAAGGVNVSLLFRGLAPGDARSFVVLEPTLSTIEGLMGDT